MSVKSAAFGQWQNVVADNLGMDDSKKLCLWFNLTPKHSDDVASARNPGLTLLKILTNDDRINEENISSLCNALKECGLARAARIAQQRFDEIPPGIDEPDATLSLSDADVRFLKSTFQRELTKQNCYELAICFGLPTKKVDEIMDSRDCAGELVQALGDFCLIVSGNFNILIMILKDRGLQRIANIISARAPESVPSDQGITGKAKEQTKDNIRDCCICKNNTFVTMNIANKVISLKCKLSDCGVDWVSDRTSTSTDLVLQRDGKRFYYKLPIQFSPNKVTPEEVDGTPALAPGDHIRIRRYHLMYDHHAIVVTKEGSEVEVIEWGTPTKNQSSGETEKGWSWPWPWKTREGQKTTIRKSTLKDFTKVAKVLYEKCDPPDLVIARAYFLMENNTDKYSITENNCESFATFCKVGTFFSIQGDAVAKSKLAPFCNWISRFAN